ncbi:hypothetical protein ACSU64_27270 [Bacillaceae bacterium C204]|uniref:hypothetical protein n=1 Tax=Neobacillus sp. 204 TaxID=3383351 RepID=UPI00397ACC82
MQEFKNGAVIIGSFFCSTKEAGYLKKENVTNGGIIRISKKNKVAEGLILKSIYAGIVVFIVVFIIGILIPESNFKAIIMAFVVGLTAMVANLIFKNKH